MGSAFRRGPQVSLPAALRTELQGKINALMDGVLVIDKPAGLTSHDVVARARRVLKTKRVGHTGTLDPFATGVLVLVVGKATRLAQFLDKDEKEYDAVIAFGSETDTGDKTGTPKLEHAISPAEAAARLAGVDMDGALAKFRGEITQTPPMYSAKKIEGRKLYDLARRGIEVERAAVAVTIHKLDLLPREAGDPDSVARIRVVCSAGTYIRTLAEDIGRTIGIGAHLTELRRTRAGRFDLKDALELEKLEEENDVQSILLPVAAAVDQLPSVCVAADRIPKTMSGLATRISGSDLVDGQSTRMVDESGDLIAIGTYNAREKHVKPKIVLV